LGIKFGEIDSSQILDNEFRIMVLKCCWSDFKNKSSSSR